MNILIVEDELLTLERMVDLTRSYSSCRLVTPCSKPQEALAAADACGYDVALLDIQLPDMSGLDLAAILQNHHPGMSIIFMTAYNHFAAEAFDLEAQDYLLKPVREERLHRALKKVELQRSPAQSLDWKSERTVMIQAFNHFAVTVDGQPIKWRRRKAAELFAFLLSQPGHIANKYQLCDALWPDQDYEKALVYLQTVIYQLRQNLHSVKRDRVLIRYVDQKYQLALKSYHYDIEMFETATGNHASMQAAGYEQLKSLFLSYKEGYLAHEDWHWSLTRQYYLAARYNRLLEFLLVQARERGEAADEAFFSGRLSLLDG